MDIKHIKDFNRGWVVGDFEPSLIRSKDFEFAVKYYKAGDKEAKHVHKVAKEITVAVFGKFLMGGKELNAGDVLMLEPGEPSDFECLEDGATAVIKAPSVLNDKYPV